MKNPKSCIPFSNCPFHLETNLIKSRFFHFGQLRKFFQVSLRRFRQKKPHLFCLSTQFQRYLIYICTKFRLKTHVTTSCINDSIYKISSFIQDFNREIYGKLNNIHLRRPPLISQKRFQINLNSSKFVYTRVHSSILIYIRLHSSFDSSTLLCFCLHSTTGSSVSRKDQCVLYLPNF